jgi:hypothetical protein
VILPLHLGELHAYEQWLVAVIAFGPFVVLGIVVYVVRGREPADDDAPDDLDETSSDGTGEPEGPEGAGGQ